MKKLKSSRKLQKTDGIPMVCSGCRALMRLQLMDGDPSSVLGQVLALRETSKDIGLAYRCQLEVNTA
jgi:hypothetical protein